MAGFYTIMSGIGNIGSPGGATNTPRHGPRRDIFMATEKSSAPHAHPSTRKARTNLARYRSLERRYWNGSLTLEEEQRFEDLIYALRSLYKAAR
jgi:hypothetical protein